MEEEKSIDTVKKILNYISQTLDRIKIQKKENVIK